MSMTGAVQIHDISRRRKTLTVAFTPAGNYASPEPIDLTAITNPKFLPGGFCGSLPTGVKITNAPLGFTAELTLGATLQTCSMKVFKGGTELTVAAYPAGLSTDPFIFDLSGAIGKF